MKKRILIVEDESKIRELLVTLLELNYIIVEADTPIQGLTIISHADPFDLIASDICMPFQSKDIVKNGYQMVQMAKKISEEKKIKFPQIIFMSGNLPDGLGISDLKKLGEFIEKPFGMDEFQTLAMKLLGD
jgi:CheY-like chemotaxis protein